MGIKNAAIEFGTPWVAIKVVAVSETDSRIVGVVINISNWFNLNCRRSISFALLDLKCQPPVCVFARSKCDGKFRNFS